MLRKGSRLDFEPGVDAPVQPGRDGGNAMRAFGFGLSRPENDRSREREHQTHFRRFFASLWQRAEARTEEGLRTQEKEETARWRAVAVQQFQLHMA